VWITRRSYTSKRDSDSRNWLLHRKLDVLQRVEKWSRIILLLEENAMAKVNLSSMDVQSLLNLRKQVDEALADRRT
jgi:hypothetical protein